MASTKDLRKRITSVRNTQQITKAMKMVAAAKLRRAQEAVVNLRPYAQQLSTIVSGLTKSPDLTSKHLLLKSARTEVAERMLLIVVTSDRGLCGGFNTSVLRAAQQYGRTNARKYKRFEFGFVGKKGYEFFKNKTTIPGRYYQNFFLGLKFSKSQGLAEELVKAYLEGEYDEIKFIYNEFKSAISQKVVIESLLPIRVDAVEGVEKDSTTIFEPNPDQIIERLLPKHFAVQVHRILLESLASEHGARMAAMENATKNAGEMIYKLALQYNKSRQASITKELLEIVSGSEAQKN